MIQSQKQNRFNLFCGTILQWRTGRYSLFKQRRHRALLYFMENRWRNRKHLNKKYTFHILLLLYTPRGVLHADQLLPTDACII